MYVWRVVFLLEQTQAMSDVDEVCEKMHLTTKVKGHKEKAWNGVLPLKGELGSHHLDHVHHTR